MTAEGVHKMKLNAETKHCSAKHKKEVKVNNSLQHWAGCIMVDVCMKFHLPICLGVHETELNAQIKHCRSRSVMIDGSEQSESWRMCV